MCAAGFYKSEAGFGQCSDCADAHMTSFAHHQGAVDVSECLCVKGYMPDVAVCVPCSSTMYKAFIGNDSCVSCPTHNKLALVPRIWQIVCVTVAGP